MWFVSTGKGTDTPACGTESQPCTSLDTTIKKSNSNDRINLLTTTSDNDYVNHCASEPILHNLTVMGTETSKIQLGCIESDNSNQAVLFLFNNASIVFQNVIFTKGDIVAFNAKLDIQNCKLQNVVIFLMAPDKYVGDYMQTTTHHLSDTAFSVRPNVGMTLNNLNNSTCSEVTLRLTDITWDYTIFRLENAKPLDVPYADGIQVACNNVDITITHSFLADKEIDIYSNGNLQFFMTNSTFQGQEGGNNVQGGIHFNITYNANITVVDTVFSDLKFYDLISAHFALRTKLRTALTIILNRMYVPKHTSKELEDIS